MTNLLRRTLFVGVLASLAAASGMAAELQPRTLAAFDRYARLTEVRMSSDGSFLWVDGLSASARHAGLDALRRGEVVIERLTTTDATGGAGSGGPRKRGASWGQGPHDPNNDAGQRIDVPDGLIHHWVGLVFVPGATVDQALALLQDYDRHAEIYRPAVTRSTLRARDGDIFRVYLRFSMKKVITVVMNTENEARFTRLGPDRAQSRIYSTRIAEVEEPDTPREREAPVGRDGGYLWRLYTYWRFLQRDGGTYVQCESISLTRGIPTGFGWLVGPFVTSVPRESLEFTLQTTRATLGRRGETAK